MTKNEKMLAIRKMEENPRVKNLQYDHVILDDEREDSIWYDGWLMSFLLDDKYRITFLASGEIRGWLTVGEEERRIRNSNVVEELLSYGIKKDSDICYDYSYQDKPLHAKCGIDLSLNNWFEFEIIDTTNDENITGAFGTDVVSDFDDMFNLIEIADDYIKEYNS